ncbi:hypothetical protein GCM10027596_06380 [Nocardioides korecus]
MTVSGVSRLRAPGVLLTAALLATSGCGSSSGGSSSAPSSSPSASSSASASPGASTSPSPSASSSSGTGSGAVQADGRCGGGRFPTKVVTAARGVSMTVPASWKVVSGKAGAALQLFPPGTSKGDGFLFVQPSTQTLDRASSEALKNASEGADVVGTADLRPAGLEARLTTLRYPSQESAFSVSVVAVGGGVRVFANMTRNKDATEQAQAESCLSSVRRSGS